MRIANRACISSELLEGIYTYSARRTRQRTVEGLQGKYGWLVTLAGMYSYIELHDLWCMVHYGPAEQWS